MEKQKIIAVAVISLFVGVIAYFFFQSETAKDQVPSIVTGEKREIYEWAKTAEVSALLEQIPCYCGCKYEGHKHARHCFWRDDGTFDKHGVTCSVCLDIAKKAKQMHEQGTSVCEIRQEIDQFYEPNKHLGTDTPLPDGCY